MHSFGLADSVAPVLGLFVHSWVPIRIVEDYAVSTCQVDTDTTASRGGDEAEDPFVKVESINELLSVLSLDRSIKSDVNISVKVQELLKDIQHLCHLSKYDTLGPFVVKCLQQLGHLLKFTTVILNQILVRKKQYI